MSNSHFATSARYIMAELYPREDFLQLYVENDEQNEARNSDPKQRKSKNRPSSDFKPNDQGYPQGSIARILGGILKQVRIGTDVWSAGISLPCWMYEPYTVLQRQAEMVAYNHLLDTAVTCDDSLERLVYVAGLAVSGYAGTQRFCMFVSFFSYCR